MPEPKLGICANCGHFENDHDEAYLKFLGRPEAHCAYSGFPCPCPGFVPLEGS